MSTRKLVEAQKAEAKVPDQKLALAAMILKDHAAGAHAKLPLPRCPECGPVPDELITKPARAEEPIPTRMSRKPGAITITGKPAEPIKTTVKPRRFTKRPVPQVVEQPAIVERPRSKTGIETSPGGPEWHNPEFPRRLEPLILKKDEPAVYTQPTVTREAWLLMAVEKMTPWLAAVDVEVPAVRISTGWPGGRGPKEGVRGQCWMATAVADGKPAIFISPDQDDVPTILGIVLHEMIHAAGHFGHRGSFAKTAAAVGFMPVYTSSENKTPELVERIRVLAEELPPLDHSKVGLSFGPLGPILAGITGQALPPGMRRPAIQTTRMLKVSCVDCGCIIRMTQRWIDEAGLPKCGCGGMMEQPL